MPALLKFNNLMSNGNIDGALTLWMENMSNRILPWRSENRYMQNLMSQPSKYYSTY